MTGRARAVVYMVPGQGSEERDAEAEHDDQRYGDHGGERDGALRCGDHCCAPCSVSGQIAPSASAAYQAQAV